MRPSNSSIKVEDMKSWMAPRRNVMSVKRMVFLRPVMSQSVPPTAEPMAPPMKRNETIIPRWVSDKLNSFLIHFVT